MELNSQLEKYETIEFFDYDDISDYALDSVVTLQKSGIINGTGSNLYEPQASATELRPPKLFTVYYRL